MTDNPPRLKYVDTVADKHFGKKPDTPTEKWRSPYSGKVYEIYRRVKPKENTDDAERAD